MSNPYFGDKFKNKKRQKRDKRGRITDRREEE
jgi:hypothetical protein